MSLEIDLSEPHAQMLQQLREEHGDGIEDYLRERVEAELHESYQHLRANGE